MRSNCIACRIFVLVLTVLLGLTPAFAGGAKLRVFVTVVPVAEKPEPFAESSSSFSVGATLTLFTAAQSLTLQIGKLRDSMWVTQLSPIVSPVVENSPSNRSVTDAAVTDLSSIDNADLVTEVITVP